MEHWSSTCSFKSIMKVVSLISSLFILISCANQEQQQEDKWDSLYVALKDGSLSSLEESVGETNISGESHMHNYLSQNCSQTNDQEYAEKATFLIKNDAKPVEKEFDNKTLENNEYAKKYSILRLKAPLSNSLQRGCIKLTSVFLDNMAADDIALASKNYHAVTKNDLVGVTDPRIDTEKLHLDYLSNLRDISAGITGAVKKNDLLCKEGNQKNCEANEHLKNEGLKTVIEAADSAFLKYCVSNQLLSQEKKMMKQQLEFGKETGVASPKTYDAHAQQAQYYENSRKAYDIHYFNITKSHLTPQDCPPDYR